MIGINDSQTRKVVLAQTQRTDEAFFALSPKLSTQTNHTFSEIHMPTKGSLARLALGPAKGVAGPSERASDPDARVERPSEP